MMAATDYCQTVWLRWLLPMVMNLVATVHAADFPVPDSGDVLVNGRRLVAALNAAMATPDEGDRILIDPGVRYTLAAPSVNDETAGPTGLPILQSDVVLIGGYDPKGALTTIERQDGIKEHFRILLVRSRIQWVKKGGCVNPVPHDIKPNVRIERVRIRNGYINGIVSSLPVGGGILNEGGELTFFQSEVNDNWADTGGGIANMPYRVNHSNSCAGVPFKVTEIFEGNVTIQESTLRGNEVTGYGGGIANRAPMEIEKSTLVANSAHESGGAIHNSDELELINSTVSGNFTYRGAHRPGDAAAGIQNNGHLRVRYSTVASNHGTGIVNDGVDATIANTILAGNVARYDDGEILPYDCYGAFRSGNRNIIGVIDPRGGCTISPGIEDQIGTDRSAPLDARLGPLASNGGATQTHALLESSPAINRGATGHGVCPVDDQRGIIRYRTRDDLCDIGAYEVDCLISNPACNFMRATSVCLSDPYLCRRVIIPEINLIPNFPKIPDCLLQIPGCRPSAPKGWPDIYLNGTSP